MKVRFLAMLLVLCSAAAASAQTDDRFTLSATAATGVQGDQLTVSVNLDNTAGTAGPAENISGWSYGLCHDANLATVLTVVDGATSATINNGAPPAFNSINAAPMPGDGFAVGVVIDLFNAFTLPPGTGYELNVATYELSMTNAGTTTLDFCDTLATPPVETLIVYGVGASSTPVTNSGALTVNSGVFHFSCPPTNAMPGDMVSIPVMLENTSPVQGFSFGLVHDSGFMTLTDLTTGAALNATNGGAGPEFVSLNLTPTLPAGATGGVTFGIVISLQPPFDFIPVGTNEVAVLAMDIATAATGSSDICFSDQVGTPTVDLVVTVTGATQLPTSDCCTVSVGGMAGPDFIRGDANTDGVVDISDGLFIAWWFFGLGPAGTCEDAADANGNGQLDTMMDPLTVLNFLFVAGAPPVAPFPMCGSAPALVGCVSSACP